MEDNMGRLCSRSLSFDGMEAIESPLALLPTFGSGKLIIEGSLSFKGREADPVQMETMISIRSPKSDSESCSSKRSTTAGLSRFGPTGDRAPENGMSNPKHQAAAARLQKVYKSFRTRRQLADCAVLVEQQWWKLLDFALLKRNSVTFFDIEKPETAVSRWSRARMRAAKVGKGLSRDEKAHKLALQHWLEAIDPRHRYGHNLHFYYHRWLHCESKQPFFYWLDVGEGKDLSLEEHCPRWKLHKQCIKYLGPKERESYEVIVEDARLMYKLSRQIVATTGSPKGTKWIFVLSTCKTLYIGQIVIEAEGHIPALQLPCRGSHICCREASCREWNSEGCMASQRALPANRTEFSGVHELSEGEECRSYQCKGAEQNVNLEPTRR